MITAHLLTKNNEDSIQQTLESISKLRCNILVGDLGSVDNTVRICEKYGARVINLDDKNRSIARNHLASISETKLNFYIEPWETFLQGHNNILGCTKNAYYLSVLRGNFLSKEVRVWNGSCKFINPIFEKIHTTSEEEISTIIRSENRFNPDALKSIENWKKMDPISSVPLYYETLYYLSSDSINEFIKLANSYLFKDNSLSISATMIRYYYAYVELTEYKRVQTTLKLLNLCLCANPLMAEFWCMIGDVNYFLLDQYKNAMAFYENAIALGSKRLKNDKWPMDISKYNKYPKTMIQSCQKLMNSV